MKKGEKIGIGELSKRTDVKIETIRYYEREKLLPEPPRTAGGHRFYSDEHIKQLTFIRRSRQLGFSMEEIRELLVLVEGKTYTCGEVKELTLEHAKSVRQKIADLKRMEATLHDIASQCSGDSTPECPIIDTLSATD